VFGSTGRSAVEQVGAAQPRVDLVSGVADALAANGQASADRGALAGVGVLLGGGPETADGVGRDGQDGLPVKSTCSANVLMIIGGRTFQSGLASSTTS
jgi:hypothetical protein